MVNDKLSTGELEIAGTADLSLNDVSHLANEFKRKSYFFILIF